MIKIPVSVGELLDKITILGRGGDAVEFGGGFDLGAVSDTCAIRGVVLWLGCEL